MAESSIEWTHYTFNPWWGCSRVSPGCEHCYAETFDHRLGADHWGPTARRRFFGQKHWGDPLRWDAAAASNRSAKRLVFCASMADVFEDYQGPDARELRIARERLWITIEQTPNLTWQLLTKRPWMMRLVVPEAWQSGGWPANVWAMTSVEDQARADARVPELLRVPARVLGVSYEPALGPVDFTSWLHPTFDGEEGHPHLGLDWVIVGGESGPGARPFDVAWARSVVRQSREAGVACFMKQVGARPVETSNPSSFSLERVPSFSMPAAGGLPTWHYQLKDRKGGDPAEWPADLRVREFPA